MPTISVSTLPTTSLPTQSLNRLKQSQVDAYNRDGLLLVPNLFNNAEINQLKQLIQIDPTIEHEIGGPLDSHGNASEFFAFSGCFVFYHHDGFFLCTCHSGLRVVIS